MVTCYSPVRHSTNPRRGFLVRLACVKHAASVHPEPGSNSPFESAHLCALKQVRPGMECVVYPSGLPRSEMGRSHLNRIDGSLFSDSHVSIRTTRWLLIIYQFVHVFVDSIRFSRSPGPAGPVPSPEQCSVRREKLLYAHAGGVSTRNLKFLSRVESRNHKSAGQTVCSLQNISYKQAGPSIRCRHIQICYQSFLTEATSARKQGGGATRLPLPGARPVKGREPPVGSATSCPPADCTAVLSAMEGLTAGFGMGPGVPPPPWSLSRPGALAGTLAASIARKRIAWRSRKS